MYGRWGRDANRNPRRKLVQTLAGGDGGLTVEGGGK